MKALQQMLEQRPMGELVDMKIKIVGSGDQEEINAIRHTTEIFLIERRIRQIVRNHELKTPSGPSSSLTSEPQQNP